MKTTMIVLNAPLDVPPDDQIIWRYMDLAKLLSLLQARELFFSPLRFFDDPFEGHFPPLVRDKALQQIGPELRQKSLTEADLYRYAREVLFVNCWHVNSDDSAAMWSLYSCSAGVAVRSTVGRLRHAMGGCAEAVTFGMVRYIDFHTYSAETLPEIRLSHLKRKSFEHERELRASIFRHEVSDGIKIPINTNSLILDVLVSPKSPDWLVAVVRDVALKYGLGTEVRKSDLYSLV